MKQICYGHFEFLRYGTYEVKRINYIGKWSNVLIYNFLITTLMKIVYLKIIPTGTDNSPLKHNK